MATIKPVNFPQFTKPPASAKPLTGHKEQQQTQALKVQSGQAIIRSGAAGKSGVLKAQMYRQKSNREETLAAAISVLEEKTIQFYHADKTKSQVAARLGQIIDVKA